MIFEKAINVQYFDCKEKAGLDQKQQAFFFLPEAGHPSSLFNDFFIKDRMLANFWAHRMNHEDRTLFIKHLDVIESEMRAEEHKPLK